jgi:hypothetical protein
MQQEVYQRGAPADFRGFLQPTLATLLSLRNASRSLS